MKRLGIPAFCANLLNDISPHGVRSAITAAGVTVDVAPLVHRHTDRQLFGTGQGTVEGPLNWILVADIIV